MALIFVTRQIPQVGIDKMRAEGHEVVVSEKYGVLTNEELVAVLKEKPYEGMVSLLTDTINAEVLAGAPAVKIVANYAVGYNNIDVPALNAQNVVVTNTPGVLTDTVAEFTVALILSTTKRIAEADRFTRANRYEGWAPELLLGSDLQGKTLGIVGAGRIGSGVARRMALGFGMKVKYYDVTRSEALEKEVECEFVESLDELLGLSDVVSIHVPLLPQTQHLINAARLAKMKPSAYLINTSRGPVIDEAALVVALKGGIIKGVGLDVYENEPALADGLMEIETAVLTPHIASASEETRDKMSEIVADNIIAFFKGEEPPQIVKL